MILILVILIGNRPTDINVSGAIYDELVINLCTILKSNWKLGGSS
jgi:hypothetical protein